MVNAITLLKDAKDLKEIERIARHEAQALVDTWMDPDFLPKITKYMKGMSGKRKNPEPKL